MVSKAAKPAGTDLNGIPNAISPGSLYPAVVTRWPRIVLLISLFYIILYLNYTIDIYKGREDMLICLL